MLWLREAKWRGVIFVLLLVGCCGLGGCGVNTPGRMEWVQLRTEGRARVGTVYLIRGWMGIFSSGIDEMARQLNEQGVTAYVYQPEQHPELGKTMVERYKGVENPEPICFVGHSRGVDASLIIARELQKVGVKVDLIVALDSVDETTVPKNVDVCYNYWMPGFFPGTNLLRGIPLVQEAGSTGKLHNIHLSKDAPELKDFLTTHAVMDKAPKLQKRIIEQVLAACPERSKWQAQTPAQVPVPVPGTAPATVPAAAR